MFSIFKKILRKGVVVVLLTLMFSPPSVSAAIPPGVEEDAVQKAYSGIHFTVDVDRPFPNSTMSAFPNGKDSVQVNLEAIRSDGTFSENQPLLIEQPNNVTVSGPRNTGCGSFTLFVSSKKPVNAKIIVKIANYPRVKTSFTVNFRPRTTIINETDTASFVVGQPILFSAQIDPVEARGLKDAKLKFVSIASFFLLGAFTKSQNVKDLKCTSDGLCSVVIDSASTNILLARRRTFRYTFAFSDQIGNKFTKSFSGTLIIP